MCQMTSGRLEKFVALAGAIGRELRADGLEVAAAHSGIGWRGPHADE